MNILWGIAAGVVFVIFLLISIAYFARRSQGKSYFAVSATSAIAAVWASYAALLSVNWPGVLVAWILRDDARLVVAATQPNLLSIVGGFPMALATCYFIYKLASARLHANNLPLNASARELEEPGKKVGLVELATAHARYRLGGRVDKPLANPGEDPFELPDLPARVDWPTLAADMLVQLEPNLDRDTFRFLDERVFFTLEEHDVRNPDNTYLWVIRAIQDSTSYDVALDSLDTTEVGPKTKYAGTKLVICVHSNEHVDKWLVTKKRRRVRLLSLGALIENTLDFNQYATSLVRRFAQRPVPGTNFTLLDSFVSLKARSITPRDQIGHATDRTPPADILGLITEWSGRPGVDHLSVIGEFGQGKSTVLLAFCHQWALEWLAGGRARPIPLLIELRGKSPRRQAPDRFLAEWGDRYGLRGGALLSLVQAGRAILIFEGFDEVQDAGLRFDRFEQFKALWAFSYPGAKLVFTGRPNFFLDTREREKLLRSSQVARDAGLENTRVLSIQFLDESEISVALRSYPDKVRKEIIATCRRDQTFFNIAKRPSMLPVIGNQWERIKSEIATQGDITSASIIGYFIDFLYRRKDADLEKHGEYQLLHSKVRHYFTQRVAWEMAATRSRNTIDMDSFVRAIEEAYGDLDAQFRMSDFADPDVVSSIGRLKEQFKNSPRPQTIAAVATDVRTNGLFVPDPAGGRDNLYFPHKQYLEFIIGEVFIAATQKDGHVQSWARRLPRMELVRGALFEPVSLFFASGMLTTDQLSFGPERNEFEETKALFLGAGITWAIFLTPVLPKPGRTRSMLRRIILNCPLRLRRIYYTRSNMDAFRSRILIMTVGFMVGLVPVFGFSYVLSGPAGEVGGVGVISVAFFSLIAMLMTTSAFLLSATLAYDVEACYVLMEIYRCGSVRRLQQGGSERSNAAVICLIARTLPMGAVEIPKGVVDKAITTLRLSTNEVLASPDQPSL